MHVVPHFINPIFLNLPRDSYCVDSEQGLLTGRQTIDCPGIGLKVTPTSHAVQTRLLEDVGGDVSSSPIEHCRIRGGKKRIREERGRISTRKSSIELRDHSYIAYFYLGLTLRADMQGLCPAKDLNVPSTHD